MTKIVINACYGGFDLSPAGYKRLAELKGLKLYIEKPDSIMAVYWTVPPEQQMSSQRDADGTFKTFNEFYEKNTLNVSRLKRADPHLVQVVEELGAAANGQCAKLKIEDLAPGTLYRIDEYDGYESIETQSTVEWQIA